MGSGSGKNALKPAMAVMSTGIEMGVAIAVGYFIGNKLDGWLGTGPWLMYLFLVLGIVAAFRGLWRTARRYWPGDDDSGGDGPGGGAG